MTPYVTRIATSFALLMTACGGEPTLTEVQTEVFSVSCVFSACHTGASGAAGLSLEAPVHAKIVGVASTEKPSAMLVVAGDPDASFLLDKLLGRNLPEAPAGEQPWVQMPVGGMLEEERIELVRGWIEAGAKDN